MGGKGGYIMKKKYSEGPWEWWGDNTLWSVTDNNPVLESDDDGKPYGQHAALISHNWDKDVKEANKKLIAATPDLLGALQLALQALEEISNEMTLGERYTNAGQYLIDALQPSREAISKALGECDE